MKMAQPQLESRTQAFKDNALTTRPRVSKCDAEIGFIGSSAFIGIVIAMMIIPRLSDIYGRKRPIMACQLLQLPIYFWMFYMTQLWEAYICFFCIGLGFVGSVSINALFMMEFVMKKHRALVLTVG